MTGPPTSPRQVGRGPSPAPGAVGARPMATGLGQVPSGSCRGPSRGRDVAPGPATGAQQKGGRRFEEAQALLDLSPGSPGELVKEVQEEHLVGSGCHLSGSAIPGSLVLPAVGQGVPGRLQRRGLTPSQAVLPGLTPPRSGEGRDARQGHAAAGCGPRPTAMPLVWTRCAMGVSAEPRPAAASVETRQGALSPLHVPRPLSGLTPTPWPTLVASGCGHFNPRSLGPQLADVRWLKPHAQPRPAPGAPPWVPVTLGSWDLPCRAREGGKS